MVISLLIISHTILSVIISGNYGKGYHAETLNPPGEWTMVKNEQGVQTFFRWISREDGTAYRERKGETIINCSVAEAIEMITVPESTKKWMANIKENYILENVSKDKWLNYTLFSIPWPFSNRDLVSLYHLSADHSGKSAILTIECKDTHIPPKDGITRLTDYHATWTLMQTGEKSVKVSLVMSSSSPPVFPRYIQDPVIEKVFHGNMVRLKEVLQQ